LPPPQQQPHEPDPPSQAGALLAAPPAEANTESFFTIFVEPQCGHLVPRHRLDRTSTSLSRSHFSQ
jgi:hypothetical protein